MLLHLASEHLQGVRACVRACDFSSIRRQKSSVAGSTNLSMRWPDRSLRLRSNPTGLEEVVTVISLMVHRACAAATVSLSVLCDSWSSSTTASVGLPSTRNSYELFYFSSNIYSQTKTRIEQINPSLIQLTNLHTLTAGDRLPATAQLQPGYRQYRHVTPTRHQHSPCLVTLLARDA